MVLKNDLKKTLQIGAKMTTRKMEKSLLLRSRGPNPPPTTYVVLVWVLDAENKHQVDLTRQAR